LHSLREEGGITPEGRPTFSLPALLFYFLKIGAIGFGGGMAVIALIERDLIRKKQAIGADEFLHGIALGQILGPFAVNAAVFIGNRLYGPLGGLACAAVFLIPSILAVILLSWLYFGFHAIPAMQSAIDGLGPVVIALILSAAWSMRRKAIRSYPASLIAIVALTAALLKVNAVYVLGGSGLIGLIGGKWMRGNQQPEKPTGGGGPEKPGNPSAANAMFGLLPAAGTAVAGASLSSLALTFIKAGCVFFGGGFVLIPILHQKLVEHLGWLSPKEFLDGVAISNLTPGPIAVLATFAGFRLHGVSGALIATLALFAPALILMTALSQGYSRFKDIRRVQDFLGGVTPAVVGMVVSAAVLLAPGALHGLVAMGFVVIALLLLLRFQWHPAWVLAIGAILGATRIV
jgi:chromate transporter